MHSYLKITALALFCGLISGAAIASGKKAYVQINAGAAFAESFTDGGRFCDNFFGCTSFSVKDRTDTGYFAGMAFGYYITEQFRLEAEAMFQSNELDKSILNASTQNFGNFSQITPLQGQRERTTFLINGYFDFKNSTPFTPYITGGLGGYYLKLNADRGRPGGDNDLDLAWQLGAGAFYSLNKCISFDLRYRYLSGEDAEIALSRRFVFRNRTEFHEVGDHQIVVGVRFGF